MIKALLGFGIFLTYCVVIAVINTFILYWLTDHWTKNHYRIWYTVTASLVFGLIGIVYIDAWLFQ